ncbi:Hypothetical predicted protein [Mytilus galloprovincialis]|uniref:Protein kinase domain-containing protein n=1 Tax=Mytilus galloprovincialis TaxID=29158 RepID=A0A8B6EHM8_MYTGA|nr:Hypothetical predicted protein [Mytilus galloprovincialis]
MEKYETIKKLGIGGCGAVYLVKGVETKKLCALKKIEVDDRRKSRTKEAIQKEAKYVLQKGYLEKSCTFCNVCYVYVNISEHCVFVLTLNYYQYTAPRTTSQDYGDEEDSD